MHLAYLPLLLNKSSRRKIGMAYNPLFIIPDFFCIFQTNFAMATIGLKEIAEFFWKMQRKIAMPLSLKNRLLNYMQGVSY